MVLRKTWQSLATALAIFALLMGLAGCSSASSSGSSSLPSGSSLTSADDSSDETDSTTTENEGESSASDSEATSKYGTLDPDWRSSCIDGYRTFDTSAVEDWQVPTPEIQDLVDRIEARYGLGLEFVGVSEDGGGWRYNFQDKDAQNDPYGGDSLSIKVMPEPGMYAAMGLYCVNAEDAVGVSEMVAEVFGYDTYPIDEVESIFSDPDADEGSGLHYEGGPVYQWAYEKNAGGSSLEEGISFIGFAFA